MSTESPSGRADRLGLRALSIPDLLSIALAPDEASEEQLLLDCTALLRKRGINRLADLSPCDLQEISPLPPDRIQRLLAMLEIGRRSGRSGKGVKRKIGRAQDVYERFQWLEDESREHFCAVFLDTKSGVLSEQVIHIGTINMSVVGPREVFREALREGAASLIVVHNHPSGDPTPSEQDYEVTEKLAQVGEQLDLPLLDHIIVGHNSYSSFKELGYL